jgi:Asp-tRNA(Asn)/Glu-tRNA(Gln) amidotransferase A subunit family amidase
MLLQVVFDASMEDMDDSALAYPWIEPAKGTGDSLTIGILPEDPQQPLHPSMQRTLATAIEKLKAAGHQFVDLSGQVPFIAEASDLAFNFFRVDPDQTVLKRLSASGEPAIPSLRFTYDLEGKGTETTLRDFFDFNAKKAKISSKIRGVYLDNKLDLIIAPGFQTTAVPHDTYGVPMYTVLANLVDV